MVLEIKSIPVLKVSLPNDLFVRLRRMNAIRKERHCECHLLMWRKYKVRSTANLKAHGGKSPFASNLWRVLPYLQFVILRSRYRADCNSAGTPNGLAYLPNA